MRAAIYDPYIKSLGGGERYMISAAKTLSDSGWDVDVESDRLPESGAKAAD